MHQLIFILCFLPTHGYDLTMNYESKKIYIIDIPVANSERTYFDAYSNAVLISCILTKNEPRYNLEYLNRYLKRCLDAILNTCRLTHKNDQPVNYMAVQSRLCGMIHVTYLDQDITFYVQSFRNEHVLIFMATFHTRWSMNCENGGLRIGSANYNSTGDRYFCGRILPWNFVIKADTVYIAIELNGLNRDIFNEEMRLYYYSQNPSTAITTSQMVHYYGAGFYASVRKVYFTVRENIKKHTIFIQALVTSKIDVNNLCLWGTGTHKTDHLIAYDGPGDKSIILYSAYSKENCTYIDNLKSTGAILTINLFQKKANFSLYYKITAVSMSHTKYILTKTKNTFSSQSNPGFRNVFDLFVIPSAQSLNRDDFMLNLLYVDDFLFNGPNALISDGIYECQYGGLFFVHFGKSISVHEKCGDARGPIFQNIYEVWVVVVLWYGGYSEGHARGAVTYTPCSVETYEQIQSLQVNIAPRIHSSTECFILYTRAYNGDFKMTIKNTETPIIGPLRFHFWHSATQTCRKNKISMRCFDTDNRPIYCTYYKKDDTEKYFCDQHNSIVLSQCVARSSGCSAHKYSTRININRGLCTRYTSFFPDILILPQLKCVVAFEEAKLPMLYLFARKGSFYKTMIFSRGLPRECTEILLPTVLIQDNHPSFKHYYRYTFGTVDMEHNVFLTQAIISVSLPTSYYPSTCRILLKIGVSLLPASSYNHTIHNDTFQADGVALYSKRWVYVANTNLLD